MHRRRRRRQAGALLAKPTGMKTFALALVLSLATACIGIDSGRSNSGSDDDDDDGDGYDQDDCKIEGSAIGVVGLELSLGDVTVVFDSWTPKSDSPGEFAGFSFHTSGGTVGYLVKTGTERWHSTDTTWQHPNGLSGPEVPAISNVDYCEECEDGDCDDGDCNDPDGCGDGDGDSGGADGGVVEPDPECTTDDDCATGEFCEGGTCHPIIG